MHKMNPGRAASLNGPNVPGQNLPLLTMAILLCRLAMLFHHQEDVSIRSALLEFLHGRKDAVLLGFWEINTLPCSRVTLLRVLD